MKTIIAGSRTLPKNEIDTATILGILAEYGGFITEIVSGGAKGVDKLGENWSKSINMPVIQFIPNWKEFGKSAGPIRNEEMAKYADACICFWDGKSKGTANMIKLAIEYGLKLFVFTL